MKFIKLSILLFPIIFLQSCIHIQPEEIQTQFLKIHDLKNFQLTITDTDNSSWKDIIFHFDIKPYGGKDRLKVKLKDINGKDMSSIHKFGYKKSDTVYKPVTNSISFIRHEYFSGNKEELHLLYIILENVAPKKYNFYYSIHHPVKRESSIEYHTHSEKDDITRIKTHTSSSGGGRGSVK